jgi:glycosyltransferase involved in cell wall biosynthesis
MHFIAITQAIKDSMIKSGIISENIDLIPNGVELPSETASLIESQSVVYVGNFSQGNYQKAFDVLFDAWIKIINYKSNLVLHVLGGGDYSPWLKYLQKNGLEQTVVFHGSVSDVGRHLKQARMFILPSRVEGLSNALLEAMSWGLPVIVTDIPANQDLAVDNSNCLVIPVDDIDALARAVIRLSENDSLSLQFGFEARKTIETGFSIEHVTGQLERLYKKLNKPTSIQVG